MWCSFVYTLISTGEDYYTEQLAVSAFSLKYYNPSAKIILITDQRTIDAIHSHQMDSLLQDVNEVIIAQTDSSFNGIQRSRQLKTSIRNLVEGDVLFIDTDTIITGKVEYTEEIDNMIVGAVYDCHNKTAKTKFNKTAKIVMEAMGWNKDVLKEYFNSGIIFIKNCKEARDFYKKWNENWIKTKDLGYNYDQLSFAYTNIQFDNLIKPLPFYFNTQVNTSSLLLISNALILHLFYGSNKTIKLVNILTKFSEDLYLRIKRQKKLSDLDKREIIGWKKSIYPEIEKQSEIERKLLYKLFEACMQGKIMTLVKFYYNRLVRKFYPKKDLHLTC